MTALAAIILAPFAVLTLFFAVEVFAGLVSRPMSRRHRTDDASAVVVIPAHDEELVIGETVRRTVRTVRPARNRVSGAERRALEG